MNAPSGASLNPAHVVKPPVKGFLEKLDGNPCLIHLAEIVRVLEINPITLFYPEMGEENAVRDELQILLSQCDANELDLLLRISKAVLSGNTSGKPAQTE